ncbi:MAG TPA: hypothetical protein VFS43_21760 [Polyangiaceae bacterium]|nr:hypothetical protein [Polyangiaceae bacterium]
MFKSIYAAVLVMAALALGACADGRGEPGEGVAREAQARGGLVIGDVDYKDVACHPVTTPEGFADGVARFRPDSVQDEHIDACSAVLLPGDFLLTASACIWDPPMSKGQRVGTITFGERAKVCGGTATEIRRSYPAAYVRHDDGLGVMLLKAGPQVGGSLPPGALYPTIRFATELPPVGSKIALAAYQSTDGLLQLQDGADLVGYFDEFFYNFILHNADAESLGLFYQEPAAGGALVYEYPDDPGYWYVFGIHLGAYPLDDAPPEGVNLGMPFNELIEVGFLDGVPLDGAPADGARDPFCATFPDHPWC